MVGEARSDGSGKRRDHSKDENVEFCGIDRGGSWVSELAGGLNVVWPESEIALKKEGQKKAELAGHGVVVVMPWIWMISGW
jgi:hypothetical protein